MHDLGSAQELTARPQTVTPGSSSGLNPTRAIAPREPSVAPKNPASNQGEAMPNTLIA